MFWGLNEIVCIKPLAWCPAHSKCSVDINVISSSLWVSLTLRDLWGSLLLPQIKVSSFPFLVGFTPRPVRVFDLTRVTLVMVLLFTLRIYRNQDGVMSLCSGAHVWPIQYYQEERPQEKASEELSFSISDSWDSHRSELPPSVHMSIFLFTLGNMSGKRYGLLTHLCHLNICHGA